MSFIYLLVTATIVCYTLYCLVVAFPKETEKFGQLNQHINKINWLCWALTLACLYVAIQTNTSISILMLIACVIGIITLLIGWLAKKTKLIQIGSPLFWQLGLLLLLRVFGWESFQIPSLSMYNSLDVGDYVIVNKHAYHVKFPELGWEIVERREPKRGEVIVFYSPEAQALPLIKRVIAIGGDTVRILQNEIYVNREQYKRTNQTPVPSGFQFTETNLNGKDYSVVISHRKPAPTKKNFWVVPEGYIFVMGDNRNNSRDSRYYGLVPMSSLIGQAESIWMHWPSLNSIPSFKNNRSLQ